MEFTQATIWKKGEGYELCVLIPSEDPKELKEGGVARKLLQVRRRFPTMLDAAGYLVGMDQHPCPEQKAGADVAKAKA